MGRRALYVGGWFVTVGSHVMNRAARWDGRDWSPLAGPGGTGLEMAGSGNPNVKALAVHDGALVVGGFFDRAGGVSVNNVARWDGSRWSPLGPGIRRPAGQPRALPIVEELAATGALAGSHLLPSVRGELLTRLGRTGEARTELENAVRLCGNERERTVLERKLGALA